MFRSVFIKRKTALIMAALMFVGSTMPFYAGDEDLTDEIVMETEAAAMQDETAEEPDPVVAATEDAATEDEFDGETPMEELQDAEMEGNDVSEIIDEADGEELIDFDEELFTLDDIPEADAPTSGKFIHCETAEWSYDSSSGKLTISGSGAMDPYDSAAETPWAVFAEEIKKIEVMDGINSVSSYAFAGLNALTEMIVADSVEFISYDAVEGSTENLIIYGSFGKKAESFAAEKNIRFLPVDITDLSDADITLTPEKYTYNGSECRPSVKVVKSVTTLAEGLDYSVSYSGNTNAGTAKVIITGQGQFSGSAEKTFTINAVSIDGASVTGLVSRTYTGSAINQAPSAVTVGGKNLVSGTDYTVSWNNNINVGTASVIITGKGNYTGSVTKTFAIGKAKITKANVAKISSKPYTGKKIKPVPVITISGRTLKKGTDFTVKYKNNKKLGKATVTITGKGNYTGKVKVKFKIRKASIADMKIKGIKDKEYTGKAITQKVKVKYGKKKLVSGRDFTVSYENNVNRGTATVIIKGKGNYKGKAEKTFNITAASIRDAKITGVKDMPYTGKAVTLKLKVKVGSKKLKEGRDYTAVYKNNVRIGTATVTLTGKGNYKDTVTKTFQIRILPISEAKVTGIRDVEYTGRNITQSITVKMDDTTLQNGKDYTVAYSNNVSVGTATMTIRGIGSYTGTLTKQFSILPVGTSLTKANLNGRKLSVEWTSREGYADGYEVWLATNNKFEPTVKRVVLRDPKKVSYLFVVDTAGARYYVRIRTFKTVNGKTYYSNWRMRVN